MTRLIRYALALLVCLTLPTHEIVPAAAAVDTSVVRALLFYDPGSSQTRDLFAFYLPGLQQRYGPRLEVSGVDTSTPAGARVYVAAQASRPLPPLGEGTPTALVGDRTMVGLEAIAGGLGDRFDDLAKDPRSADWPVLPGLDALLQQGVEAVAARVAKVGIAPEPEGPTAEGSAGPTGAAIGNAVAVAVLAGMAATLLLGLARVYRGASRPGPRGAAILIAVLLIGVGISLYTGYASLAHSKLVCGPIGSCADVQESPYAKLFGIPMGVLGVGGYLAILIGWLIAWRRSPQGGGWHWFPWAIGLAGLLFSIRLTFLEPFVIGATCTWCLGSAVSMTLAYWILCGYVAAGRAGGDRHT